MLYAKESKNDKRTGLERCESAVSGHVTAGRIHVAKKQGTNLAQVITTTCLPTTIHIVSITFFFGFKDFRIGL